MLEYRRPDPSPGPQWITERASWIFEQREACSEPNVAFGPPRPLARSAYATVTLRAGTTAGAANFEVSVVTADDEVERLDHHDVAWEGPDRLPDAFFRFGVAYPGGRATSNLPGASWSAPQDGPVVVGYDLGPRGRAGEIPGFVAGWTVWPVPPPGPVVVACAWPAGGVPESQLTFDGRDFRPPA